MSQRDTPPDRAPLVEFDPEGNAPILSYNVPEPTSYSGRNYLELGIDSDWFRSKTKRGQTYEEYLTDELAAEERLDVEEAVAEAEPAELATAVESAFRQGRAGPVVGATDARIRESLGTVGAVSKLAREGTPSEAISSEDTRSESRRESTDDSERERTRVRARRGDRSKRQQESNLFATAAVADSGSETATIASQALQEVSEATDIDEAVLRSIQPTTVAGEILDGRMPIVRYTMGGRPTVDYTVAPPFIQPRLMLVERYRLSTYLGSYGAGRTIETFSLLPGERTTISVKTFRKTEEEREEASSILDSYTTKTAEEFEQNVASEQSYKEKHEETFAYHAEAKASAGWGWGKAEVSGGVEGSSNAAREEFAKNVSSATSKHAAEASSKRDIEIDTSYKVREETGEETSIERELENINLSRTLNFVFRQMNQEFVTMLHLEDVRVGYTNGGFRRRRRADRRGGIEYREVPLSDLDDLLEDVVVEDQREQVKDAVEAELSNVVDYRGETRSIVDRVELGDGEDARSYLRIDPSLTDTYADETGNEFTVPGIILSADKNVMRTEGIVVEALLGQSDALDEYSNGLQEEAVRTRVLENQMTEIDLTGTQLGLDLVESGDEETIDRFERIMGILADVRELKEESDERDRRPVEPTP